jgi:hypothetical protein
MSQPTKRCKFIDDSAELSGEDAGGEDSGQENDEEENEEDRKFIDDTSQESEEESKVSKVKKSEHYLPCHFFVSRATSIVMATELKPSDFFIWSR